LKHAICAVYYIFIHVNNSLYIQIIFWEFITLNRKLRLLKDYINKTFSSQTFTPLKYGVFSICLNLRFRKFTKVYAKLWLKSSVRLRKNYVKYELTRLAKIFRSSSIILIHISQHTYWYTVTNYFMYAWRRDENPVTISTATPDSSTGDWRAVKRVVYWVTLADDLLRARFSVTWVKNG